MKFNKFIFITVFLICRIAASETIPVILDNDELPFNRNYEIRFYDSMNHCKVPTQSPISYQIYTQSSVDKLKTSDYMGSLWAKVVEGDVDKSHCSKGIFYNNKVVFKIKPKNFGDKRIVIVISNSQELSYYMGGKKIWDTLTKIMITSYQMKKPVTLVTLNEDQDLSFVVQAEDLCNMHNTHRRNNTYPELTKEIRSKITLDQCISEPMKSLYVVHDYFKNILKKIIYITDKSYVCRLFELKDNPYYSMMPLHWDNNNVSFEVLTNGRCNVWKKIKAKCSYSETLRFTAIMNLINSE